MKKCNAKGCEPWDCDDCKQTACCDKHIVCDDCECEGYEEYYNFDSQNYSRKCFEKAIYNNAELMRNFLIEYTDSNLNLEKDFYVNYLHSSDYQKGYCERMDQYILDSCKNNFIEITNSKNKCNRLAAISCLADYCKESEFIDEYINDFKECI